MTTPRINITAKQLHEIYTRDGRCDHYIELRKYFGFNHLWAKRFSRLTNGSIENISVGLKLELNFGEILEQLKRRRNLPTLAYLVNAGETFAEAVETYDFFRYDPSAYSIYGTRRRQGVSREKLFETIMSAKGFGFDTDDLVSMCLDWDIPVLDALSALETGLSIAQYIEARRQSISHEEVVEAAKSCRNYKDELHKRRFSYYVELREEKKDHQTALEASKTLPVNRW